MSKVELQNITKIYDKTIKALDDISFTVNDGEFFVLLGPTGAGKTTTLRSIAGLEKLIKERSFLMMKISQRLSLQQETQRLYFNNTLYTLIIRFTTI